MSNGQQTSGHSNQPSGGQSPSAVTRLQGRTPFDRHQATTDDDHQIMQILATMSQSQPPPPSMKPGSVDNSVDPQQQMAQFQQQPQAAYTASYQQNYGGIPVFGDTEIQQVQTSTNGTALTVPAQQDLTRSNSRRSSSQQQQQQMPDTSNTSTFNPFATSNTGFTTNDVTMDTSKSTDLPVSATMTTPISTIQVSSSTTSTNVGNAPVNDVANDVQVNGPATTNVTSTPTVTTTSNTTGPSSGVVAPTGGSSTRSRPTSRAASRAASNAVAADAAAAADLDAEGEQAEVEEEEEEEEDADAEYDPDVDADGDAADGDYEYDELAQDNVSNGGVGTGSTRSGSTRTGGTGGGNKKRSSNKSTNTTMNNLNTTNDSTTNIDGLTITGTTSNDGTPGPSGSNVNVNATPTTGRRGGSKSTPVASEQLGGTEPDWTRTRKDNHKEVERRRRETINEGINRLKTIVPHCDKNNKGAILSMAVDYIKQLKDSETNNIEKWTMEKLLSDQSLQSLRDEILERNKLLQEIEKQNLIFKQHLIKLGVQPESLVGHSQQQVNGNKREGEDLMRTKESGDKRVRIE
ncbi:basic helix-loop-helix protein [Microbotryomycetes sp. JL221]|nr:basic helix-loop-helix protein [Microbotryomycetes sp. JL221]